MTRRCSDENSWVVWLLADQHRAQAIAMSGMPLCCPFRGSLLTGKYPHECVPGHEYPLPKRQPTITEPLKAAGYQTAWFGKWHLGGFHESMGRAAGVRRAWGGPAECADSITPATV